MSAPRVTGAFAATQTKVRIQFDQTMLADAAMLNPASYTVPGFDVVAAGPAGAAVVEITLNKEMLAGAAYVVVVQGPLKNIANEIVAAAFKDAAFLGLGDPPKVVAVAMLNQSTISVTWDQNVTAGKGSFSFLGPSIVTVTDVQAAANVIVLKVSPNLLHNALYKLISEAVEDEVGNKSLKSSFEFSAVGDQPKLLSATLDSGSQVVALKFSKPMGIGVGIASPESYTIAPVTVVAGPVHIKSAALVDADEVWLYVTEGMIGATYRVTASLSLKDFAGNALDSNFKSQDYVAAAPTFKAMYAKAVGPRAVLVAFNRPPDESAATISTSNYAVPGLTVLSAELLSGAVLLKTANHVEGQEYQLTVTGVMDEANNPLPGPQVLPFNGWRPTVNGSIDMYDFMYAAVRETDERQGTGLLRRLFAGWQDVWTQLIELREGLSKQLSPLTVRAEYLPMELWSAGWSEGHEAFVASLDERTARRLLAESPNLWRERGSETAYENGVKLIDSVKVIIRNWFWARWVEGEDWFGEDRRGWDIHILDLPGYGNDEYYSQIRIVDADGKLHRPQIEHVLDTLRPVKEILQICYIQFFCKFTDEGDDELFTAVNVPDLDAAIVGGKIEFAGPASALAVCRELGDCVLYARVQGHGALFWGVAFRRSDADNMYRVEFDVPNKEVRLVRLVAGVTTTLAAVPAKLLGVPLEDDLPYGVRIQIVGDQIRVFLDGADLMMAVDNSHPTGAFGLFAQADTVVACTELEGFALPLDTATLGAT